MKKYSIGIYILTILLVTAIAVGLRLRAVELLPIDYDEDDYLGAAQRYTAYLKSGDIQGIIDYEYNYEHPPLTKLVYGLAIYNLPEAPLIPLRPPSASPASNLPEPHFHYARLTSAFLGTLETLSLAIINPLAGLFLAVHTWQIKYTSQIMLEPLPALTSLLAVMFYYVSRKHRHKWFWLSLSAIFLGITAAGKYTYAVVGLAILVDWLWEAIKSQNDGDKHPVRLQLRKYTSIFIQLLIWGMVSIVIFVAFNPRMWSHPVQHIKQSILFHGDYAQSSQVAQAGYPAWQQLVWLAGPVPWHPGVFLMPLDLYIGLFAVLGFQRLWRKRRVFALWLLITLIFLLFWPTKWPQYVLTLTAPLCLSASEGFSAFILEPIQIWWRKKRSQPTLPIQYEQLQARQYAIRDTRRAMPWLAPGIVTLTLIALFPLIYQGAMALTDFNAISIRDGIQGGVWRAVWKGVTGQEEPVVIDPIRGAQSKEVHYAGPVFLISLLFGSIPDLLVFNVLWTILSVVLQTFLGIIVALLLHRRGVRFVSFYRVLFILPWAIPEFVGALIWLRILEPGYGWLAISQNIPADVTAGFLSNPNTTLGLLLVAATWYGFPFVMLAATAGLKMVPEDVYDAAAIDGANSMQQFRFVTWPLLLPLVVPAILIRSIFAFNQFYLFYTMRVEFPTLTFATLSYFIFSPTFGGQFAISAAINIFTVLVLVVLILWFNRVSRASEGVTYAS